MMIRPMLPELYPFDFTDAGFFISATMMTVAAVIVSLFSAGYAARAFHGDKKKTALCFAGIAVCAALSLICFFGCAAITVKGILFALILAFCSYEDIKTRECADYLHLMIVIAAFLGTELSSVPNMTVSALFAGGVMLAAAVITKDGVGGADIKMAAACSFLLGLGRGILGLFIGMILAVAFNIFKKDKKKGFPMIPYLAAGYMAAFYIQI